jgi:hypothetical protein
MAAWQHMNQEMGGDGGGEVVDVGSPLVTGHLEDL